MIIGDEVIEYDKNYYIMEYTCNNCGHIYNNSVPKGCEARGIGGKCPYCGAQDYGGFKYRKPASNKVKE